jgi:ankyrin repeat protein
MVWCADECERYRFQVDEVQWLDGRGEAELAQAVAGVQRFLGSPTLRVNGRDVDPAAPSRDTYGLQCRIYQTPDGLSGTPADQWIVDALIGSPAQAAAVDAIHAGDQAALQQVLTNHPDLATARLTHHRGRTLLHIATDWPGHFPNVAATITALVRAGADSDAPSLGHHAETPLHWAASSDDIDAIDALLDAGANIDSPGGVIAGGSPLADATAFGQWAAARHLVERSARTTLWEAAALGLLPQVQQHLNHDHPTADAITHSFWAACHGRQLDTASYLLDQGADINWTGYDNHTPLDAAQRSEAEHVVTWLQQHSAKTATTTS